MGKLYFGATFPISGTRIKPESNIKLSGIRHSRQSEKWMPEGKTERRIVVKSLDGTKTVFSLGGTSESE